MILNLSLRSLFVVCALVALSGCKKELIPGIYRGEEKPMGNGKVWNWLSVDAEGNPQAIGISLTDAALENLPDSIHHPSGNDPSNITVMFLPPADVSQTPFNHTTVNWNPKGHIPVPIYDKPHFDFHFYMITNEARMAIGSFEEDSANFKDYPEGQCLPVGYINPGKGEPQMGAHWVDQNAPELKPNGVFTETFIYGSYDGRVTFYEPMITYAFLQSVTDYTRPIPQPSKVIKSLWYPQTLRIHHRDGVYHIQLENFVFRKSA